MGKPITGDADIATKEQFVIDPELFQAFCKVFEVTQRDSDAVHAIARKAKKSELVEVPVSL